MFFVYHQRASRLKPVKKALTEFGKSYFVTEISLQQDGFDVDSNKNLVYSTSSLLLLRN